MNELEGVLYGIRHFGIPTRTKLIEEARELVAKGLLPQGEVDAAIAEFEKAQKAKNLATYGTAEPTEVMKREYSQALFDRLSTIVRSAETEEGVVKMYEGKYSKDVLRTSSLAGCIATIIYVEDHGIKGGILTHYPPLSLMKISQ